MVARSRPPSGCPPPTPLTSPTCGPWLGRLCVGERHDSRPREDDQSEHTESDTRPHPHGSNVHAVGLSGSLAHCRWTGKKSGERSAQRHARCLQTRRYCMREHHSCVQACTRRSHCSAHVWLLPGSIGVDQRAVSSSLATIARVAQLRGLDQNTLQAGKPWHNLCKPC